jgi:hypothetical protein
MNSNETSVSKKGFRSNFLNSLHRHHQVIFILGLFQIGVAVVLSSLSWKTKNHIILPETEEVYSHPPLMVIFMALLLINALVFALIGATHGSFWFRLIITSIVTIILLVFGWLIGAFTFLALPSLFTAGYVLWRGSRPMPGHPTIKDIFIIYAVMLTGWLLGVIFGIRLSDMTVVVTLYLGIAQILVFFSFLPIPQILMSGIDLANLIKNAVERVTSICERMGSQGILITLLATSIVKVGFIIWSGGLTSVSSWIVSGLFLLCFIGLVRFTPKSLLDFKPLFKHWLFLTGFLFPIPIATMILFLLLGVNVSTNFGSILMAQIGPIGLLLAGVLAFFPAKRPFSIFIMLMAIWGFFTFSLMPLSELIFGKTIIGLNLWYIDTIAAIAFIIWSIGLLYKRKTSPLITTALKFSLFFSGCFLLDQLLNDKVAVAELYSIFQVLTYLAIHQLIVRPKQLQWSQVLSWLIVIILIIHRLWFKILPDEFFNMITIAILILSMLWDVLIADEKITGQKQEGSNRLGLLFLYQGVVTWTVAQIVFAKTGKGTAVLEWEPILFFGLLSIGIPWVLYLFLNEIKTKLT